jgi:hypothetical protein
MSYKPFLSLRLPALLMLSTFCCLIQSPFAAKAVPGVFTGSYETGTDTHAGDQACAPSPAVNCGGCPQEPRALPTSPPAPAASVSTKWDLWSAGTALRGANVWQAAVYGGRDKTEFKGMETHYDEPSFAKLRRWDANYVNISHPGTFSVQPLPVPSGRTRAYQEVKGITDNLIDLINKSAAKEMFVVVSFRTGPGRNELVFEDKDKRGLMATLFATDSRGNLTDKAKAARQGWVDMWKDTAKKLKGVPNVVGYDLMVEPVTDREKRGGGNLQEHWFSLALELVKAIRDPEERGGAGDCTTPIIIGGAFYSNACSLSCMRPTDFAGYGRIVYGVHQYDPYDLYTHQKNKYAAYECNDGGEPVNKNPEGDHHPHAFDSGVGATVCDRFAYVNGFKSKYSVPVVINEFGAVRWAGLMRGESGCTDPNDCRDAGRFLTFETGLIERLGANHALWLWETSDCIGYDEMNFQYGTNPKHHRDIPEADENTDKLIKAIKDDWGQNTFYATPPLMDRLRLDTCHPVG